MVDCFEWQTSQKPKSLFSSNIFPSLTGWQSSIILHLWCLWCTSRLCFCKVCQAQQISRQLMAFSACVWATKDFALMFLNQIKEVMESHGEVWKNDSANVSSSQFKGHENLGFCYARCGTVRETFQHSLIHDWVRTCDSPPHYYSLCRTSVKSNYFFQLPFFQKLLPWIILNTWI